MIAITIKEENKIIPGLMDARFRSIILDAKTGKILLAWLEVFYAEKLEA
jgi:hypothetical protein